MKRLHTSKYFTQIEREQLFSVLWWIYFLRREFLGFFLSLPADSSLDFTNFSPSFSWFPNICIFQIPFCFLFSISCLSNSHNLSESKELRTSEQLWLAWLTMDYPFEFFSTFCLKPKSENWKIYEIYKKFFNPKHVL